MRAQGKSIGIVGKNLMEQFFLLGSFLSSFRVSWAAVISGAIVCLISLIYFKIKGLFVCLLVCLFVCFFCDILFYGIGSHELDRAYFPAIVCV